jgi:geranylgeranylglycerol-phosphate geranylgeranyltransferase
MSQRLTSEAARDLVDRDVPRPIETTVRRRSSGFLRCARRAYSKLWALGRLVRFENCLGAAACVLIAGSRGPWRGLTPAMLGCACVLALGNAVNDVVDVEVDRLGKPKRPLASGAISMESARAVIALLAVLVAALLFVSPATVGAVLVLEACLAIAYSTALRDTALVGTAMFSLQVGSTVLVGGLASEMGDQHLTGFVILTTGLLLLEVVKSVEDYVCDLVGGRRTVAHLVDSDRHDLLIGLAGALYLLTVITAAVWLGTEQSSFVLLAIPSLPLIAIAMLKGRTSPLLRPLVFISKGLWLLGLLGLWGLFH